MRTRSFRSGNSHKNTIDASIFILYIDYLLSNLTQNIPVSKKIGTLKDRTIYKVLGIGVDSTTRNGERERTAPMKSSEETRGEEEERDGHVPGGFGISAPYILPPVRISIVRPSCSSRSKVERRDAHVV